MGVSHNAAYRHFADREQLVEAVARLGLADLVAAMQRRSRPAAADAVRSARRPLADIGRGYVDFALAQPGLFRVVFTAYPEPPKRAAHRRRRRSRDDPFGMLNAALDDLVDVGFLAASARPGAEITLLVIGARLHSAAHRGPPARAHRGRPRRRPRPRAGHHRSRLRRHHPTRRPRLASPDLTLTLSRRQRTPTRRRGWTNRLMIVNLSGWLP